MPEAECDQYALIAELYDGPYSARDDVDFFVGEAVAAKGTVLEIGCGTGRVLIPAARAGVNIVGLDISPSMLQVCDARIRAEPDAVRARIGLVTGDMRAFDLHRTFHL